MRRSHKVTMRVTSPQIQASKPIILVVVAAWNLLWWKYCHKNVKDNKLQPVAYLFQSFIWDKQNYKIFEKKTVFDAGLILGM